MSVFYIGTTFRDASSIRIFARDSALEDLESGLEFVRIVKDEAKNRSDIRRRSPEIAAREDFVNAEHPLNSAADKLILAVRSSQIQPNHELVWKLAVLLNHLGRNQEALKFMADAERLLPTTSKIQSKQEKMLKKKAEIFLALHEEFPGQEYGEQALTTARELANRIAGRFDTYRETLFLQKVYTTVRHPSSAPQSLAATL